MRYMTFIYCPTDQEYIVHHIDHNKNNNNLQNVGYSARKYGTFKKTFLWSEKNLNDKTIKYLDDFPIYGFMENGDIINLTKKNIIVKPYVSENGYVRISLGTNP